MYNWSINVGTDPDGQHSNLVLLALLCLIQILGVTNVEFICSICYQVCFSPRCSSFLGHAKNTLIDKLIGHSKLPIGLVGDRKMQVMEQMDGYLSEKQD